MDERLTELTVRRLVERLATKDPVPGGGSAAALAGAMGSALLGMVVELTVGRQGPDADEGTLMELGVAASSWQSELLNLADLDATAYDAVVRARRMPRDTELERRARGVQLDAAIREATRIPLATARVASQVLDLAGRVAPLGNRNAISDVGVAALLAGAAVRGAALNVEINLPYVVNDDALVRTASDELRALIGTIDDRERAVRGVVAERLR